MENKEKDVSIVIEELLKIGETQDVSKINEVIKILKNDNRQIIRETAVKVLKTIKFKETAEEVSKLLFEKDAFLRNSAVMILAELWDVSKPILKELIKHKNKHIRKYALDALYLSNSPQSTDLISQCLDDEEVNNVIAAVEYIGYYYDTRYNDKIVKILKKTSDPFLICTCLETLEKIGTEKHHDEVINFLSNQKEINDIILPSLLKFLSSKIKFDDINFILQIAPSKFEIAYKEIIDTIKNFIEKYQNQIDEKLSNKITQLLLSFLDNEIPSENKYEIIMLISIINPNILLDRINEFLESNDELIQLGALELIGQKKLTKYKNKIIEISKNSSSELIIEICQDVLNELNELD